MLLRMKTEDGRLVLPGVFLPAAERFHLATKLDRWVTSTMFEWLANHPERLVGLHTCALNLSGHSLADEGFLAFVVEQLCEWEVRPSEFVSRLQKRRQSKIVSKATHLIETLKTLGCRFSLDDFGSGLLSFTYLKNLPVDYLKIDGSFVKGIASSETDFAMVKAINEVGRVLGKQTIAEYVGTKRYGRNCRALELITLKVLASADHSPSKRWRMFRRLTTNTLQHRPIALLR